MILILMELKNLRIIKSKKKGEKLKEVSFTEDDELMSIFISLNGKNSHTSPWFLNLDISKDFHSFVDKRDIFDLSRVKIKV